MWSAFFPSQPIRVTTRIRYFPFWLGVLYFRKFYREKIINDPEFQDRFHILSSDRKVIPILLESAGIPVSDHISPDDVIKGVIVLMDRTLSVMIERFSSFWLPLVLTLLFLVSISASSALGEFDALRGARSLSGNWHMPITYIYSDQRIISLGKYENDLNGGFKYGPFGLVASSPTNLYLTNLKTVPYFTTRPSIIIIPYKPDESINLSQPTIQPIQFSTSTSTISPTPLPTVSTSATRKP
jgi:hypothetical protein